LELKGFPEDYTPDDLNISKDAIIRLIDNSPDVNMYKCIFEKITSVTEEEIDN